MSEELDTAALKDMAALMESRANVYRILSRFYREEIDALLAVEFANDFTFKSDDAELVTVMEDMRIALCDSCGVDESAEVRANDVSEEGFEQLAVTFDRVFFGMGPLTARHAFPYESVYTSDKGIMMQDAYAQVVRTYREQHLAKDPAFHEPEDHLAVELAFMATLAERTATFLREGCEEAATETVQQQLTFAQGHLLNWLDRFCADLRKAAEGSFYASLANATDLFVKADAHLLSEMLVEE